MSLSEDLWAWAREHVIAPLGGHLEVKSVSALDGDFGSLKGFQFDSNACGGFLYFWESGVVEYQLVDYKAGVEVVPITTVRMESRESTLEVLAQFSAAIERLKSKF